MSFVRPEAWRVLRRYRALMGAVAVALLGLYWALFSFGVLAMTGWALLIAAGLFALSFAQAALFGGGGEGPGVVVVDEGQIAYFGPETGGAVAVRELSELSYDAGGPEPLWRLRQAGQGELEIPADAKGADALFDAFAALPGLSPERLIAVQRDAAGQSRVIWRKDARVEIDTPRRKPHF